MTTTTKPETNMQRHVREMREAQDRLHAEVKADPQFAAMADAYKPTKAEQEAIAAAEQRLREAEEGLSAAGMALERARRGMEPVRIPDKRRPFSFFEKPAESYRAAKAAEPGLRADVAEARERAQGARRRLNATVADVNRARAARRQAAKLKAAPKREPARARNADWGSMRAMGGWSGKDAA